VRIGIQTWGSEGDIRPFLALGHALVERGHRVELVYTDIAERSYDAVASALGFTARAVATPVVDRERAIEIGLKVLQSRDQLRQALIITRDLLDPVIEPTFQAAVDLCSRSDLLIHHFIQHQSAAAAELAKVPAITVAFAPMLIPSRYIHPSGTPDFGQLGNVIEWKLARLLLNRALLENVNRFRERFGLPRCKDLLDDAWTSHRLNLLAAAPALFDRPRDWPAWHRLCGFLELPLHQHEPVAPEVDAFLAAGSPPVFMGFGSLMPIAGNEHLHTTIETFVAASELAGCRAIIQCSEDPSTALRAGRASADRILFVKRTPHKIVFPRCAAVVHHAGAGTTHTTLRAGVPSVAVPHVSDQFAWAEKLQQLGVAPPMLRRTKLTAGALAARIEAVLTTPAMKAAAMAIGAKMQSDDGPQRAAELIEAAMAPKL
jgi:UDP:flavonoid glycosyltransferase YjiC (YdhE family)